MQYEKDLVVIAPDKNAEFFFRGFFSRASTLGMKMPTFQIDTHPQRDAGCLEAHEFLGSQTNRFAYALVVVADRQQSGAMHQSRDEMEHCIERALAQSGWDGRAAAIVPDPGLGRWLLERELGKRWQAGPKRLRRRIEDELLERRIPQSPELYRKLGMHIAERGQADPACRKLKGTLVRWFGHANPDQLSFAPSALEARFDALVEQWLTETRSASSFSKIIGHPAYRAIIDLGPNVIPLILQDMEQEPKHWSPALRELTGANPVPPKNAGQVSLIAADWIAWAREHGHVW